MLKYIIVKTRYFGIGITMLLQQLQHTNKYKN